MKDHLHCFVPNSIEIKGNTKGDLVGSSFVIKDLFAITDHTSSFGNAQWRETHAAENYIAPVVKNVLAAGADLVGQVKMDQLAYSIIGNAGEGEAPINPLNPECFTGGSSSGSASAVAGGLADFALGTDTVGSIRIPAAACGIFSIRPTHNTIDPTGVIPLARSFDTVGLMAKNLEVLLKVFKTVSQIKNKTEVKKVLLPVDILARVDVETKEVIILAAKTLAKNLNIPLEEIEFDSFCNQEVGDLLARLQGREIWQNHSTWVKENAEYLLADVRMRLERCEQFSLVTNDEKNVDQKAWSEYAERLQNLLSGSVLILPILLDTMILRTASIDEQKEFRTKTYRLMAPASLANLPEMVVPVKTQSGRTVGIGLLGEKNSDLTLLSIGKEVG